MERMQLLSISAGNDYNDDPQRMKMAAKNHRSGSCFDRYLDSKQVISESAETVLGRC